MMKSNILDVGICIGNQMDESAIWKFTMAGKPHKVKLSASCKCNSSQYCTRIHMTNHHVAIADLQQLIFGDRSSKNAERAILLFN